MNIHCVSPIFEKVCKFSGCTTLIFNVEPLQGDILSSLHLSEVPKDCENWNNVCSLTQDSPRTTTLMKFKSQELFDSGFGHFANKQIMISVGQDKKNILLPWTDLSEFQSTNSQTCNEIILRDANGLQIAFPVSSLWKSNMLFHIRIPNLLFSQCNYHLILSTTETQDQNFVQTINLDSPWNKSTLCFQNGHIFHKY